MKKHPEVATFPLHFNLNIVFIFENCKTLCDKLVGHMKTYWNIDEKIIVYTQISEKNKI